MTQTVGGEVLKAVGGEVLPAVATSSTLPLLLASRFR